MSTQDIAHDLVAQWVNGKFGEAAGGKGACWNANHQIHSIEVERPCINGDRFTARFRLDVTMKSSVHRIKDGKIAGERFFFGG